MTLILTALAALVVTALRLGRPVLAVKWRLGMLALLYWGAALMWCVDGIAALAEGAAFVELADPAVVLDDSLLGLSVIGLGLVVWGVCSALRRVPARA
ncbi:MAG: hypothetical protein LBK28_07835 [Propionibacteriaceae bacterium]|jgi:hypothetical protein|nr:hypothetical protein [Propionibacteriaceae bacterium]